MPLSPGQVQPLSDEGVVGGDRLPGADQPGPVSD